MTKRQTRLGLLLFLPGDRALRRNVKKQRKFLDFIEKNSVFSKKPIVKPANCYYNMTYRGHFIS